MRPLPRLRFGLTSRVIGVALLIVPILAGAVAQAGSAKRVSTATEAKQLAREVAKAHTNAARVKALDDVFRALKLGVRTPTLKRVVPGGKSAQDVYLYTDEVSALADSLGQGSLASFDDLTNVLTLDGLAAEPPQFPGFPPTTFTSAQIQAKVQRSERHWAHRSGATALYAAVIRDLGLHRHSDLAESVKTKKKVIDPLQAMLISLGLLSDAKRESGKVARVWTPPGLSYAPRARAAGGPCDFSGPIEGASAADTAKNWAQSGAQGAVGSIPGVLVDLFHGIVLGIDIEVIPKSAEPVTGEFGQDGPHSAKPMKFRVLIFNHGKPSDSVIKCGALSGHKFPGHGPVPGITVNWQTNGLKVIGPDIFNFIQDSLGQSKPSDGDGIARFTTYPDVEYVPDAGPVRSITGFVLASADTLGSTGNGIRLPMVTKDKPLGWGISWHQAHGYQIDIPKFTVKETFNKGTSSQATDTWNLKLHNTAICLGPDAVTSHPLDPQTDYVGNSPALGGNTTHGRPDSGSLTGTDYHSGPDGHGQHSVASSDVSVPWDGKYPVGMDFGLGTDLDSARIKTPIVWNGGHAQVKVMLSFDSSQWPSGYTVSPAGFTWTLPVQDDPDCPLPKPVQ